MNTATAHDIARHGFIYRTGNPNQDVILKRHYTLLTRPQTGDWVCVYYHADSPELQVIVKVNTQDADAVNRHFNKSRKPWEQHHFEYAG